MGTLYVIATPIGNLEDITLRAIRILGQVGLIAAEDTRTTRKLLARYGIRTPLTSYNDHNMRGKIPLLLHKLEEADVGLVSEAGTPTISDPGRELIAACIEKDVPVVPVPGASVIPTALAVSGLPTDRFLYLGFLPRRRRDRLKLLEGLRADREGVGIRSVTPVWRSWMNTPAIPMVSPGTRLDAKDSKAT